MRGVRCGVRGVVCGVSGVVYRRGVRVWCTVCGVRCAGLDCVAYKGYVLPVEGLGSSCVVRRGL